MQAAEAKLQRVLEGSKQFLVPHYQRPYSWQPEQWEALCRDILLLIEEENPQPHFKSSCLHASRHRERRNRGIVKACLAMVCVRPDAA